MPFPIANAISVPSNQGTNASSLMVNQSQPGPDPWNPAYIIGKKLRSLLARFISLSENTQEKTAKTVPTTQKISRFDKLFQEHQNKIKIKGSKGDEARVLEYLKRSLHTAKTQGYGSEIQYALKYLDAIIIEDIATIKEMKSAKEVTSAGYYPTENVIRLLMNYESPSQNWKTLIHEIRHFIQFSNRITQHPVPLHECIDALKALIPEAENCILSAQSCRQRMKGSARSYKGRETISYEPSDDNIGYLKTHAKKLIIKYEKTGSILTKKLVGYESKATGDLFFKGGDDDDRRYLYDMMEQIQAGEQNYQNVYGSKGNVNKPPKTTASQEEKEEFYRYYLIDYTLEAETALLEMAPKEVLEEYCQEPVAVWFGKEFAKMFEHMTQPKVITKEAKIQLQSQGVNPVYSTTLIEESFKDKRKPKETPKKAKGNSLQSKRHFEL